MRGQQVFENKILGLRKDIRDFEPSLIGHGQF